MARRKNQPVVPEDVEVVPENGSADNKERRLVLARSVYPQQLPIIPIPNRPLFPGMTAPILIDNASLANMITGLAENQSRYVGLVLKKQTDQHMDQEDEETSPENLHDVGVIAEIAQMAKIESGNILHVILSALDRMKITGIVQDKPHIVAKVQYILSTEMTNNNELKAYSLSVIKSVKELVQLNPLYKEELSLLMANTNLSNPERLADFAAALTTSSGAELQDVLATASIRARLEKVLVLLKKEIDVSKIQAKISKEAMEASRPTITIFLLFKPSRTMPPANRPRKDPLAPLRAMPPTMSKAAAAIASRIFDAGRAQSRMPPHRHAVITRYSPKVRCRLKKPLIRFSPGR